jgi:bacillithiol system protein YtxJ
MSLLTERFFRLEMFQSIKMSIKFHKIGSLDRLDELFEESHTRPVLLFKHSNSCGISADVYEQLTVVNADIHVVIVQQDRDISNAIAARLGIRHASPQAFVLWEGRPIYHATHYGIEPGEIENKLSNK